MTSQEESPEPRPVNVVRALMQRFGANASPESRAAFPFPLTRKMVQALLALGVVSVNGIVIVDAEGAMVCDRDRLAIDDSAPDKLIASCRVWRYNKPVGVDCALQAEASLGRVIRKEVGAGVHPVGKVERDGCGLLLLTSSSALCERLTQPDIGFDRVFVVTVNHPAPLPPRLLQLMRNGVTWRQGSSDETGHGRGPAPCTIEELGDACEPHLKAHRAETGCSSSCAFQLTLKGGDRYGSAAQGAIERQIRYMVESAGGIVDAECRARGQPRLPAALRVVRLERVRVGPVGLSTVADGGRLKAGQFAELPVADVKRLMFAAFRRQP